jgi:hypothetical protein
MPDKPTDERLIILLPPDLLEEVRLAAEEADLSVSQLVRRAIRSELKSIAAAKNKMSPEEVRELLKRNQIPLSSLLNSGLYQAFQNEWLDPYAPRPSGKLSNLAHPQTNKDEGKSKQADAVRKPVRRGFKI